MLFKLVEFQPCDIGLRESMGAATREKRSGPSRQWGGGRIKYISNTEVERGDQ